MRRSNAVIDSGLRDLIADDRTGVCSWLARGLQWCARCMASLQNVQGSSHIALAKCHQRLGSILGYVDFLVFDNLVDQISDVSLLQW